MAGMSGPGLRAIPGLLVLGALAGAEVRIRASDPCACAGQESSFHVSDDVTKTSDRIYDVRRDLEALQRKRDKAKDYYEVQKASLLKQIELRGEQVASGIAATGTGGAYIKERKRALKAIMCAKILPLKDAKVTEEGRKKLLLLCLGRDVKLLQSDSRKPGAHCGCKGAARASGLRLVQRSAGAKPKLKDMLRALESHRDDEEEKLNQDMKKWDEELADLRRQEDELGKKVHSSSEAKVELDKKAQEEVEAQLCPLAQGPLEGIHDACLS